jgi:hypothetical protein
LNTIFIADTALEIRTFDIENDPTIFSDLHYRYQDITEQLLQCSNTMAIPGIDWQLLKEFRETYGSSVFLCRFRPCLRAIDGFLKSRDRDRHEASHMRSFKCENFTCEFYTTGFSTKAAMQRHHQVYHSKLGDVLPIVLPIRRRGERINPTNLRDRYQADALNPLTSIQANTPLAPLIKRKHSSMNDNNAAPISLAGQPLSDVPHQPAEQALQGLDGNIGDPQGEYLDASSSHQNWMMKGKNMVGKESSEVVANFQRDAKTLLGAPEVGSTQEFEEVLETGRGFNVDMPELEELETIVQQKWGDCAREAYGQHLTLKDVVTLIEDGEKVGIAESNYLLMHFRMQKEAGEAWGTKAKELMAVEIVHYPQLEALRNQAKAAKLPVSAETLTTVDQILNKHREAHRQIISLYERSKDPDFTKRPTYSIVRETMERLAELNSKPSGTLDLEKEQKRHEDWMRKGKKLFGKANYPLHILKSHMEYVLKRNLDCFDINTDKPRTPAEPQSREPSPADGKLYSWGDPRFREVFCICRRAEAGMMIECELCHEW